MGFTKWISNTFCRCHCGHFNSRLAGNSMIILEQVPKGIEAIVDYYGKPGLVENNKFIPDREWIANNMAWFGLLFPLRQSWDYKKIEGFYINKKVGPAMIDALEEIRNIYSLGFICLNTGCVLLENYLYDTGSCVNLHGVRVVYYHGVTCEKFT